MGLREQHKANKLRRIEDAARALFAERGYDGTSTRELARRAGIASGTLFVYFPEKRDLLIHLFVSDLEAIGAEAFASAPSDGSVVDALMHVFGAYFDYYERSPGLGRVFAKELLFVEGAAAARVIAHNQVFYARLSEILAAGQRSGEVGDHVVLLQAVIAIFSAYYMALVFWLGGHLSRRQLDEGLRASFELLLRGLRPDPR